MSKEYFNNQVWEEKQNRRRGQRDDGSQSERSISNVDQSESRIWVT